MLYMCLLLSFFTMTVLRRLKEEIENILENLMVTDIILIITGIWNIEEKILPCKYNS